jgi:TPP-dependent indolepyruvate ferredoxin oxidoreductase alpha subunit
MLTNTTITTKQQQPNTKLQAKTNKEGKEQYVDAIFRSDSGRAVNAEGRLQNQHCTVTKRRTANIKGPSAVFCVCECVLQQNNARRQPL